MSTFGRKWIIDRSQFEQVLSRTSEAIEIYPSPADLAAPSGPSFLSEAVSLFTAEIKKVTKHKTAAGDQSQ